MKRGRPYNLYEVVIDHPDKLAATTHIAVGVAEVAALVGRTTSTMKKALGYGYGTYKRKEKSGTIIRVRRIDAK